MINANGVTAQLAFGMDNNYKCDLENVESIGSAGVIIGKALYNGALDLKQVLSKFKKGE